VDGEYFDVNTECLPEASSDSESESSDMEEECKEEVKEDEYKDQVKEEVYSDKEYNTFVEWLNVNCIRGVGGRVSVQELSTKSGLEFNKVKYFMKKKGYKYYNFRFTRSLKGKGMYDRGGYRDIEIMYFTEKMQR
jgi:hypothetical protein